MIVSGGLHRCTRRVLAVKWFIPDEPEFVPGQKMTWTGGMPLGLFKGVRTFALSPKGDGSIDFTVREEFSGPLLPLFAGSLPDMTEPFKDFAEGLKARAEGA